jgi:hypothetical protein
MTFFGARESTDVPSLRRVALIAFRFVPIDLYQHRVINIFTECSNDCTQVKLQAVGGELLSLSQD